MFIRLRDLNTATEKTIQLLQQVVKKLEISTEDDAVDEGKFIQVWQKKSTLVKCLIGFIYNVIYIFLKVHIRYEEMSCFSLSPEHGHRGYRRTHGCLDLVIGRMTH